MNDLGDDDCSETITPMLDDNGLCGNRETPQRVMSNMMVERRG